jgi:hypothetical protein
MLMVTWGLPKDENYGKRILILKHTILEKGGKCRYFIVETIDFVFDIPHI